MQEEDIARLIKKKVYEISYALCRVAYRARGVSSSKLEESAFDIIQAATRRDVQGIRDALDSTLAIVRFSSDSGFISKVNGDIIIEEIYKLNKAIAGLKKGAIDDNVELTGIFSVADLPDAKKVTEKSKSATPKKEVADLSDNPATIAELARTRQSAIVSYISELGNCRVKDLSDRFSNVSERTLRYDLQALTEQGVVFRIGEGGPGTFYSLKPLTRSENDVAVMTETHLSDETSRNL